MEDSKKNIKKFLEEQDSDKIARAAKGAGAQGGEKTETTEKSEKPIDGEIERVKKVEKVTKAVDKIETAQEEAGVKKLTTEEEEKLKQELAKLEEEERRKKELKEKRAQDAQKLTETNIGIMTAKKKAEEKEKEKGPVRETLEEKVEQKTKKPTGKKVKTSKAGSPDQPKADLGKKGEIPQTLTSALGQYQAGRLFALGYSEWQIKRMSPYEIKRILSRRQKPSEKKPVAPVPEKVGNEKDGKESEKETLKSDWTTEDEKTLNEFLVSLESAENKLKEIDAEIRERKKDQEKKEEPIETTEKKLITLKDIPIYMTGDIEGFSVFKEQTDKEAEKVLYYNAKDNRHLFDERSDSSDAEIIIKKETSYNKPIPEEDKKNLFNVLHLYLKAHGARGRSVTTIGIKIPEGIDPSPFMKKLAQEVYEAGAKIGALSFGFGLAEKVEKRGWGEFYKRQDALKNFAQEQFLKYANEQKISGTEIKSKEKEEKESKKEEVEGDKFQTNPIQNSQEKSGIPIATEVFNEKRSIKDISGKEITVGDIVTSQSNQDWLVRGFIEEKIAERYLKRGQKDFVLYAELAEYDNGEVNFNLQNNVRDGECTLKEKWQPKYGNGEIIKIGDIVKANVEKFNFEIYNKKLKVIGFNLNGFVSVEVLGGDSGRAVHPSLLERAEEQTGPENKEKTVN